MRSVNKNLIPLVFLLGTAVLFFLTFSDSSDISFSQGEGKGRKYSDIQKTKTEAIRKVELNYMRADQEKRVAPQVNRRHRTRDFGRPVDLEPERNIGAQDSRDDSLQQSQTLDQKMDGFIAHRQHFEAMEKIQKTEYVKEFIKEARAMGYEVVINNNLEIVKVTKVSPK